MAGTLFHEIGHTLGLSHGGLYYDTPGQLRSHLRCQLQAELSERDELPLPARWVGPNATVAFSNQTLATLNESSAGSVTQLTDSLERNPATFPTSAWYVPYTRPRQPARPRCIAMALRSPATSRLPRECVHRTHHSGMVERAGHSTSMATLQYTQMRGYNDLANMDLRQVGATGGEFASLAACFRSVLLGSAVEYCAGGNVTLGSGGTIALGSGGTVTLGSGGNVTLGSGGHHRAGQWRQCDAGQWRQRHAGQRRVRDAGQQWHGDSRWAAAAM
jgi:hypothetical protein